MAEERWLRQHTMAMVSLDQSVMELKKLAGAFEMRGDHQAADKLADMVRSLTRCSQNAKGAVQLSLHERRRG